MVVSFYDPVDALFHLKQAWTLSALATGCRQAPAGVAPTRRLMSFAKMTTSS